MEVEGEHNYYADGLLVHNKLSYNPPAVTGVAVGSGVITRYVGSLSEETKGSWVNHVFLGSTKIATVTSSEVRYYFQDHLGSANVVTDSAGSQIELIEYKPFGEFSRRDQFGTSNAAWYYFTGKPLDDETGLMFYGARYYSPLIGRFITPDTIVQGPMNPQTLNRYSYCGNNPVNHIDPDGHSFWKSFAAAFIGAIAAVLTAGLSVGFTVLATQGLSALTAGTLALSGAVGGAISGGVGAALNGAGWGGILQGAAIGGVLGGIGGFAAGGGFGGASAWIGGGLLAGSVANAAINNSWADLAGGFLGGITGTAVGVGAVKLSVGSTKTQATNAGQQVVEDNPQDLQGAIDAGRSSGGESGAIDTVQAASHVEIDVRGAVQKLMLDGGLDGAGDVKVRVPWSPRGSIGNSVGRAGVFRGGPKSIVMRATNSLGVAAKAMGKLLGATEAIEHTLNAVSAFQKKDYLTFSHEFGMAGLSTLGVVSIGAGKFAPYLGTIVDYGTKPPL